MPCLQAEKSITNSSLSATCVKHYDDQLELKRLAKQKIMPISSVRGKIHRWMADTGASIDAIDILMLSKAGRRKVRQLHDTRTFETAAGDVHANSTIDLFSEHIGEINAVLLKKTPPVISIGKRCMQLGFGFYWPPYTPPHIILPDGKPKIECAVEDFVPYILEEKGTVCPIAAGGNSEPSSSSHALACDESLNQPAKENTDKTKDAENHASGCEDKKVISPGSGGLLNKDDIPLMKLEAMSTYHMLTHTPKNPYCTACQRAKMQRKPHRKKKQPIAERMEAEEFGDVITGDHIVTVDR